jgi:transposase
MTGNPCWRAIPTKLGLEQFEQFVLPHLSRGRRGPPPTLSSHKIFNYILQLLYMGCQWKMLPIERNTEGLPEIHYTRIYRAMRRWQANGFIEDICRLGAQASSGPTARPHVDRSKYRAAPGLRELVEGGRLGKKFGHGVDAYE